jgi:hypothetical protein
MAVKMAFKGKFPLAYAIVCKDIWFIGFDVFEFFPTISIEFLQ